MRYDLDLEKLIESLRPKKKLNEIRIMMIKCLNNALSQSATLYNIQSGFKASGVYPLNQDIPMKSKYAMNNSMREKYPHLYEKIKNGNLINNHHLNGSPENLAYTCNADFHRPLKESDQKIGLAEIKAKIEVLHTCKVQNGKALTPVPDLLVEENGKITRVSLE